MEDEIPQVCKEHNWVDYGKDGPCPYCHIAKLEDAMTELIDVCHSPSLSLMSTMPGRLAWYDKMRLIRDKARRIKEKRDEG